MRDPVPYGGALLMAGESPLRALFVTPELAPWVKSGGLGDVSGTLPAALRALGADVRVLVPGYSAILDAHPDARAVAELTGLGGALPSARLLATERPREVPLLILDCPECYARAGTAYQDEHQRDWADNHLRFGLLSRAAALLAAQRSPFSWRPQVLHCHDWPAGLAPPYLHFEPGAKAATVMTVHNLAFQGIFPAGTLTDLGLPQRAFHIDGVEFYGKVSFLKGGLFFADRLTTVSPGYAAEIQTEEMGCGLGGLLRHRRDHLTGILNGIDTAVWNPALDPFLAAPYDFSRIDAKAANKAALQRELALRVDARTPLLGAIGRLTHQKGLDLLLSVAPEIAALPAQLVVLGTGERMLERGFAALADRFPGTIAAAIRFEDALAHRIEAGSDLFLMPSRFEPCGLNQMYSLRYGTPPVVRATGGLRDTVIDATPEAIAAGNANGFVFSASEPGALREAVLRAVRAWRDPATWRALQRTGMAQDFSWRGSARRYLDVFQSLARQR
jgi:starch synthase